MFICYISVDGFINGKHLLQRKKPGILTKGKTINFFPLKNFADRSQSIGQNVAPHPTTELKKCKLPTIYALSKGQLSVYQFQLRDHLPPKFYPTNHNGLFTACIVSKPITIGGIWWVKRKTRMITKVIVRVWRQLKLFCTL